MSILSFLKPHGSGVTPPVAVATTPTQIGRFGLSPTLVLSPPVTRTGDQLSLTGAVLCDTEEEWDIAILQLLGLQNSDEPFVPLIVEGDNGLVGWVEIVDVTWNSPAGTKQSFTVLWSITARWLGAQATIETAISLASRVPTTNNNIWLGFDAVPVWRDDVDEYSPIYTLTDLGVTYGDTEDRTDADGTVRMLQQDPGASVTTATWIFSVAPAAWYKHAPRIEITTDSGTTYSTMTGRRLPSLGPFDWRLSNGLCRVRMQAYDLHGGTGPALSVEAYNGTAWSTPPSLVELVTNYANPADGDYLAGLTVTSIRCLHNSADQVGLSILFTKQHQLEVWLARGHAFPYCRLTRGNDGETFTMRASVLLGGATKIDSEYSTIVSNTAGNEGQHTWLAVSPAAEIDQTNGRISTTAGSDGPTGRSMEFAFGVDLPAATTYYSDTDLIPPLVLFATARQSMGAKWQGRVWTRAGYRSSRIIEGY